MNISEDERRRINQAVADAEAKTAAEIVPVIAQASGRYDRPEDIAGLWLGLLGLVAVWLLLPRSDHSPGSWEVAWAGGELLALLAAVVCGFVVGAVLASRIGGLRRLFTSTRQMQEEVAGRARVVFVDSRVHHTSAATGVLIYISLFERMAHVLADQAVYEKLGPEGVNQLCARLVDRLAKDGAVAALVETIQECGNQLGPLLPRDGGVANELPNALVVMD